MQLYCSNRFSENREIKIHEGSFLREKHLMMYEFVFRPFLHSFQSRGYRVAAVVAK